MSGSGPFADDERCQDFVRNLVRMRTMCGWSQPQLADRCHFSKGVISNIESYQRAPRIEHGQGIDDAFGVTNVFESKARAIQNQSYPEAFASFPEQEATADDLYIYEHSFVPGLIQTEAYVRATFATLLNITAEEVEQKVAGRIARQEVLFREDGNRPRLWALVDEAALDRPAGSPEVMYEQCMRILEVSKLPYVSLAVVPYSAGGHIGLTGACTIVERAGIPRAVNLEDFVDGRVSEDPEIVRRAALRFRSLQQEALPSGASRELILRKAENWKQQTLNGARALTVLPTEGSA